MASRSASQEITLQAPVCICRRAIALSSLRKLLALPSWSSFHHLRKGLQSPTGELGGQRWHPADGYHPEARKSFPWRRSTQTRWPRRKGSPRWSAVLSPISVVYQAVVERRRIDPASYLAHSFARAP